MKTKRRHELQTNILADWLGTQIEVVRPYIQYIVGGVIALVAIVAIVMYQVNSRTERQAQAWRQYLAANSQRDTAGLEQVATQFPGSAAALWALQAAGDMYLDETTSSATGLALIYSDRETAKENLAKAQTHFRAVLNGARKYPLLRQRSEYSLAQTYELMAQLDQAKEHYENVAKGAPDSVIGKLAAHSAVRLEDPAVRDIYKQIAGEIINPATEFPDLPRRPDLSFPDLGTVDELAIADPEVTDAKPDQVNSPDGSAEVAPSDSASSSADDSGSNEATAESPQGQQEASSDEATPAATDDTSQP